MASNKTPPKGYVPPELIWAVEVEYPNRVDPDDDGPAYQLAAFNTKRAAKKALRRLESENRFPSLRINAIPVHARVKDWEWDR